MTATVELQQTLIKQIYRYITEGSNKMNPDRPIKIHIIIKVVKFKEKILKAAREKQTAFFFLFLTREPL